MFRAKKVWEFEVDLVYQCVNCGNEITIRQGDRVKLKDGVELEIDGLSTYIKHAAGHPDDSTPWFTLKGNDGDPEKESVPLIKVIRHFKMCNCEGGTLGVALLKKVKVIKLEKVESK